MRSAQRTLLTLVGGGMLVGGCNSEPAPPEPAPSSEVNAIVAMPSAVPEPTATPSATPMPTPQASPDPESEPEMAWRYSRGEPRLVYGEPATDNLRLAMRCPVNDDNVVLSFMRPSDVVERRPDVLTVSAGRETGQYEIMTNETQLGVSIEVVLPKDDGPLRAFREGDPLEIWWGKESFEVPFDEEAAPRIARFFDACVP
ncbi:hypothetical protein [Stakelama tenebrarum]|uniref:Lipoprotein n=1 Tax=Stakelama tenebrarum TaxID=2711215 RepID=A0A6G6Y2F1_9SPHN|nr:hypothetical protein [Sphingosinithalassobacter tenebrarum]QIG79021.1 hypothetical protein G5C33_03960 [Sphingosinithalassobacter tenebrarum]